MRQNSLFAPPELDLPDAKLKYIADFLSLSVADTYLATLTQTLRWQQDHIKIYGREVKIPRLQAWYGEPEARYQYSGLSMAPLKWTPELLALKRMCEQEAGAEFNSVLANLYRDGEDTVGWHGDNEAELGRQPVIASISLGVCRAIDFRHNISGIKKRLPLEHGSLLLMSGNTQQFWQHSIARSKKIKNARINLTFRYVYGGYK